MAAAWRHMLAAYCKSEYFLLNLTILASYLWFRLQHQSSRVDIKAPFAGGQFATFHSASYPALERQVGITLLVTLGARVYRSTSASASLSTLLAYTQLFVLVVTALTDWVTAVYYVLAFGLVFLLVSEPGYNGPDQVETLHAASFADKCMSSNSNGGGSSSNDGAAYVVFLHTNWSSRCRHAYPLFAELCNRYATTKLRFARLDVGTWPRVARQLGVDLSTVSSQLPSVVLFEKGHEVARVPAVGSKQARGQGAKYSFSKVDLIRGLQLDARYAQTMNK